ncbi:transposase [Flavobacterium sp. WC2416]|uniref:Transposase n=2 Tax=unclassified Flavobacterium TaxID=196869 RepID=A0AB39WCG1_9FLAO
MKNRKRNRMKGFDYSSNNIYFVTICVQNRECCFGYVGTGRDLSVHHRAENEINDSIEVEMDLNKYGKIVEEKIIWLQEQYKYVEIHNYVVMPNHVHIIIEIDSLKVVDSAVKIKSLSSLIGALKTKSSKFIHIEGLEKFSWQRSFHDHIIKNENSYDNINNYIDLNPQKWHQDTFYEVH